MGCFGLSRLFRKKKRADEYTYPVEKRSESSPRPYQESAGCSDFEKPYAASGRSTSALPSSVTAIRPTAHPQYSAYAGSAAREDPTQPRYHVTPTSTQTSNLSEAATLTGTEAFLNKAKEEDVEDPEARERARKAAEARRKAEEEEQERRDFMQWM